MSTPTPNIVFITTDELAHRLGRKSKRTIQRWARERRIPSVMIGGTRLFTEDQVAEIVSAYTVEAVEPVIEHTLPNPAYQDPVVISIDPKHRRGTAA